MSSNHSAVRLTPAAITANANHTGVTTLAGWSIREAAGSAGVAAVNIRKGVAAANNTGTLLAVLEMAADTSNTYEFRTPLRGDATYGIYVEVVTGTVAGVLYAWG